MTWICARGIESAARTQYRFLGLELVALAVFAGLFLFSNAFYAALAIHRREDIADLAPIIIPIELVLRLTVLAGFDTYFRRRQIKAIVQGFGPMFQVYFTERDAIHDYRDYCAYVDTQRYSRFVHRLLEHGIYMTPSNGLHWIISTAHTERDVEMLLVAADEVCAEMA